MDNFFTNRLDITLTDGQINDLNRSWQTMRDLRPANATLSEEEAVRYQSIKDENKVFAEDCLIEAENSERGLIASFVNLDFMRNDLALFEQAKAQKSKADIESKAWEDIMRIAGKELKTQADQIYLDIQRGAEIGIAGSQASYEKLKIRYEAQGNAGRPQNDPDPNP